MLVVQIKVCDDFDHEFMRDMDTVVNPRSVKPALDASCTFGSAIATKHSNTPNSVCFSVFGSVKDSEGVGTVERMLEKIDVDGKLSEIFDSFVARG